MAKQKRSRKSSKSRKARKRKTTQKRSTRSSSLFERRLKPRVDLRVAHGSIAEVDCQAVVLGLFEGVQELSQAARAIDERMDGAISEISQRRMFLGKVGEIFILPAVRHDIRADLVVCAGMGAFDRFKPAVLQIVAENVARTLVRAKVGDFAVVLFGASRGDLYVGIRNLVDGFFRGVRGSRARNPLRSITVCETNYLRCQGIEDAIVKLYRSQRSKDVDVSLEKISLPAAPPAAAGAPSVVLQTTLVSRDPQGDTEIRFSVLGTGAKATVLSETRKIDTPQLDALVAKVDEDDFVDAYRPLAALKRYGRKLADKVVPADIASRLEEVVGDKRIILIQDSGTSRMPWETLCIGNWFPAAEVGMSRQFIADHMPVARWLEHRRFDETIDVLLITDPTEDLQGARREGDIVKKAAKGLSGISLTELRGRKATKGRVKKELQSGRYDILHYAGHTAFYPDHPEYSGIVCAHGRVLSGNELSSIQNLPAVVMFNSCESGRIGGMTQKRGGGGLQRNIGLAEAFLRGGVANYVGTHWVVSDAAAPAFMIAFYTALLNGESMGTAVSNGRQAVKKLRSRDWADYIHYGSPSFVLKIPHGEVTR